MAISVTAGVIKIMNPILCFPYLKNYSYLFIFFVNVI